jgi:hypothetical protein
MSVHRLIPTFVLVGLVAGCTMPQGAPPAENGESSSSANAQAPVDTSPSVASFGVPGTPTTAVGERARNLERDVDRLEVNSVDHARIHGEIATRRTQLSSDYFTHVAQINSRLEAGTTPGNPELVAEWLRARSALTNLDLAASQLSDISTKFTDDTAQATYLEQSIRAAFGLRGAVDADHALLRKLSGRVASAGAMLEQTLSAVLDELNRQNEMLSVEHRNLTTLSRAVDVGQLLGSNLGINAGPAPSWTVPAPPPAPAPPANSTAPQRLHGHRNSDAGKGAAPGTAKPSKKSATASGKAASAHGVVTPTEPKMATAAPDGTGKGKHAKGKGKRHHFVRSKSVGHSAKQAQNRTPLITIPVDTSDSYQRQLYSAVAAALDRTPNVTFEVVAAAPSNQSRGKSVLNASKAQHQADEVVRSLVAFGLPQTRVTTTTTTATGTVQGEIRVFAK